jgi:hypothetical protein
MLFTLVFDALALSIIVSLLVRQSLLGDWRRFVYIMLGLFVVGVGATIAQLPSVAGLGLALAVVFGGLTQSIGMSARGAAIATACFVVYRVAAGAAMSVLLS